VLAAEPRLLVAAERRAEVGGEGVDRERAGAHPARDLETVLGVLREHRAGQPELTVVRDAHRVVLAPVRDE
jgi:hypothetical protein